MRTQGFATNRRRRVEAAVSVRRALLVRTVYGSRQRLPRYAGADSRQNPGIRTSFSMSQDVS
jgi:hypothetical protein